MSASESLVTHLQGLEELMIQPRTRNSRESMAELLADEFVEFGASGWIYDKSEILAALQTDPPVRITLADFKSWQVAEHVALVTYTARKWLDGQSLPVTTRRCSIWKQFDNRWRIVFHQGAPLVSENE